MGQERYTVMCKWQHSVSTEGIGEILQMGRLCFQEAGMIKFTLPAKFSTDMRKMLGSNGNDDPMSIYSILYTTVYSNM